MEVNADVNFQSRVWSIQRIGWCIIAAMIIAAMLGVFGGGPVSRASTESAGLRLDYERFVRLQQPMTLRFALAQDEPAEIALTRRYFESFRIEQITPQPSEVASSGPWLVYRFAGAGPIVVTFDLVAEQFGNVAGSARGSGGGTLEFRQFIYP
jgi:hypothetical protein